MTFAAGQPNGFMCATDSSRQLWCWGDNRDQRFDSDAGLYLRPTGITLQSFDRVVLGNATTCVLARAEAWCWGMNQSGSVGAGSPTSPITTPTRVRFVRSDGGENDSGVVNLAGAAANMCAVLADGTAWCWGQNASGVVGDGTTNSPRTSPVQVLANAGVPLTGVVMLAPTTNANCALLDGGVVRCWGQENYTGIGSSSTTPYLWANRVTIDGGASAIAAGDLLNCALVAGTPKCWGGSTNGYAGDGIDTGHMVLWPAAVVGATGTGTLTGIEQVVIGWRWAAARSVDGGIFTWGTAQQRGQAGAVDSARPVPITFSNPVRQLSASWGSGYVQLSDETSWTWGNNGAGELGLGYADASVQYAPLQLTWP